MTPFAINSKTADPAAFSIGQKDRAFFSCAALTGRCPGRPGAVTSVKKPLACEHESAQCWAAEKRNEIEPHCGMPVILTVRFTSASGHNRRFLAQATVRRFPQCPETGRFHKFAFE